MNKKSFFGTLRWRLWVVALPNTLKTKNTWKKKKKKIQQQIWLIYKVKNENLPFDEKKRCPIFTPRQIYFVYMGS